MTTIPDLIALIRTAIVSDAGITAKLPAYKNSYPVFTRAPIPTDATYPCVTISEPTILTHEDGVNDQRITLVHEIAVYGNAVNPASDWQLVQEISQLIANLFHRKPGSLGELDDDWKVVSIRAGGRGLPPADSLAQNSGALVELNILIAHA